MNKKDILERIINLINPKLKDTLDNIKNEDMDYFIRYLSKRIESNLEYWKNDRNYIIKHIDKL